MAKMARSCRATWSVTIISTLVYLALFVSLLVVHTRVPAAPSSPAPVRGINTTEAWLDLQEVSHGFHPYNSRRNDDLRAWLLRRIEEILESNGVRFAVQEMHRESRKPHLSASPPVMVFNDLISNVTFSGVGKFNTSGRKRRPGQSVYFEGTNIIVYIRGSEDSPEDWWTENNRMLNGHAGVLVNAHYDSVSTGYGATDDGVGVVTILQLIKYYTTPGNTPRKGLVALLNNGEEDFLNGARAFTQHPMARFAQTFLNLEGAGAGGRATLFRSTDTEVTRAYAHSEHPFGSALSGDGFKRGLVRSQTDYVIFNGELGLRGLDVAFMEPRARYHTNEDDARHTSIASIWHMLSAALATTQVLTSDASPVPSAQKAHDTGSDGVWFDLFGRAFAVFELHTLFAVSITLLAATPIVVILLAVLLYRQQRFYFFAVTTHEPNDPFGEPVALHGWRGFFRFPAGLVVGTGVVVGLAYWVNRANPFIVHSSPYAVWSLMLTAFLSLSWLVVHSATRIRPSALYRAYALSWMYLLVWLALLGTTIIEGSLGVAGGYPMMFYFASVFLAYLVSLLELFTLPRIVDYAATMVVIPGSLHASRRSSLQGSAMVAPTADEEVGSERRNSEGEEATEHTSLLRGEGRPTFRHYRQGVAESHRERNQDAGPKGAPRRDEQGWSVSLPTWTWPLQILFLVPINVILIGQVGLLMVSALSQTGSDGSPTLLIYLVLAGTSVLLLMPLLPFLHRIDWHVPTLFLLICLGTLIYSLVAFPFSAGNRYKVYFLQTVDLDTGLNRVWLTGVEKYVHEIIGSIPSAAGQPLDCTPDPRGLPGLTRCSWAGIPPQVVPNVPSGAPPDLGYSDWLYYNVTRSADGANEARFHLYGRNTRACKLTLHQPISDFHVEGAAASPMFDNVPRDGGSQEIRLWRREWEEPWDVWVRWNGTESTGLDGRVVALWSDANHDGVVPALDELWHYAPAWVAITKLADGLVEGSKAFMV
ncbi:MAG: hypothetical protein M1838_000886 [Thelocarpon superellum]|nr:MAG: hypothetical protein M1838_000886 [Thelocarpon superellum]